MIAALIVSLITGIITGIITGSYVFSKDDLGCLCPYCKDKRFK